MSASAVIRRNKRRKTRKFSALFSVVLLSAFFSIAASANAQQLGASLYIAPPAENPQAGSNFTLTIKTDSLAQPINAVKGVLGYNKDKLEIINVSKIGSIFNLWIEEPQFSNVDGKLRFAGGVPKPGFVGNGGTVLLVIFKAKLAGTASLVWEKGEVLAADGVGTNILTNLQNLDFNIEERSPPPPRNPGKTPKQLMA
ncbi:MAG: hypothetical protein UV62_C0019G0002 [Parcubacteria group bacterium GW2011_GWC1_43_11]|nr:MAG: hypothetical protein UV62_C0019G0002 [Parcubacteria group bacterium GW2011_GWC1_43_11]